MKRQLSIAGLCAIACFAGIACGQLTCSSIICRDAIGVLLGRGHLLALGYGRGIYEADVQGEALELRDAAGVRDGHAQNESSERRAILSPLVANAMVQSLAANGKISGIAVDRELSLLQSQLLDKKA